VELEATHAAQNLADAGTHAAHGILLCHMGRFEEAERALKQSIELDRNLWTAHYGLTLFYEATGRHEKALDQSEQLKSLVEPEDFEFLMRWLALEPRNR
jgi:tetratricopeptide (TPR) repeat protein